MIILEMIRQELVEIAVGEALALAVSESNGNSTCTEVMHSSWIHQPNYIIVACCLIKQYHS
jgi:hypothetical protein